MMHVSHYVWTQEQATLAHAFVALLAKISQPDLPAGPREALGEAAATCLALAAHRRLEFQLGAASHEGASARPGPGRARIAAYLAALCPSGSPSLTFAHLAAVDTVDYVKLLERALRDPDLRPAERRAVESIIREINALITESVLIVCHASP